MINNNPHFSCLLYKIGLDHCEDLFSSLKKNKKNNVIEKSITRCSYIGITNYIKYFNDVILFIQF